jgi:hypothetical protein
MAEFLEMTGLTLGIGADDASFWVDLASKIQDQIRSQGLEMSLILGDLTGVFPADDKTPR